ncbi:MAG: tRNA 2-thiouridine(34) synthase MnmA [Bacteroidales bacterium]|nr:tRNA 2-thiouridine(34) synthase MnmA [Bacteroidales bacterium]
MKICIGLSGGVDSSVAAWLLKQQGYDVFAMFMQNWHDADATLHGDCEWEEDRFVAELVARKIGIPFYFVDLSKQYRQRVVDYMFDEYAKGRTPNPDVLCNREIKFDAFWEAAKKLGADRVATGHYCRKEETVGPDGKPVYRILAGTDPNKDQSYFLCQLSQEQLSKALFPIGDLLKPEVRRIAHEADLPSADKKDSQGICFVGKVDLPTFLQQKLESREGDVIEVYDAYYQDNAQYRFLQETLSSLTADGQPARMITEYVSEDKGSGQGAANRYDPEKLAALPDEDWLRLSQPVTYDLTFETETYRSGKHHVKKTRYKENPFGKILGKHEGAQFYTIGQRKGLNIGGHADSLFVIATDVEKNLIYVGEGHRHKGLSRSCLRVAPEEIHWIRPDQAMVPGDIRRYRVRIRYRQPLQDATLVRRENGLYILFDTPQRGITAGQFAVWYDGDEMLGSGAI